jgi:hypothetical protein
MKCRVRDCNQDAVDGFRELEAVGSFEIPKAMKTVDETYWCKSHKAAMIGSIARKQGVLLNEYGEAVE